LINKKEILGLIPARGGSKGLPGKNIRPLNGIPLIAHLIMKAKQSQYINRIIVATDSDEIASIAKEYGAEVPFKRPDSISGPKSHGFEVFKYTINWLKESENYTPDILSTMLCTTPFITTDDIDSCLEKMIKNEFDSCFTINEIEHHPYRAMIVDGDLLHPMFDLENSKLWANRQEFPTVYRFNGGVIAAKTEHILNNDEYNIDNLRYKNTQVGYSIIPAERAIDIDTIVDFEFAELLIKHRVKK